MALYAWGKDCTVNACATAKEKTVVYPKLMEHFSGEVIADFAAGDSHALAVTEFGDVYSWGRGKDGELGHGELREDVQIPMKIKGLQEHIVVNVACGNIHSMATTITGQVYVWGLLHDVAPNKEGIMDGHRENEEGASSMLPGLAEQNAHAQNDPLLARIIRDAEAQYRDGTNEVSDFEQGMDKMSLHRGRQSIPRLASSLLGHFIVKVAAGSGHNLALSSSGDVFSCGYNEHGQLGFGHANTIPQFEMIRAFDGLFVVDIACGQQHNIAQVQVDGVARCFTWGLGALGQLGHGTRRSFLTPKLVEGIHDGIIGIGAGSHHSAAIDIEGRVFTWGHSEYGQHGISYAGRDLYDPREYFIPRQQMSLAKMPMVSLCCGSHFTLAVGRDGQLYSWGWNAFGVLGLGHFMTTTAPQCIEQLNGHSITRVIAGYNQSGALVGYVGSSHAMTFRNLLQPDAKFVDMVLTLPKSKAEFPVHRIFLKARCPYLYGYCRANEEESSHSSPVLLDFPDIPLDQQVLKAILTYLYTDRLEAPSHKLRGLIEVANAFGLYELASRGEVRRGTHNKKLHSCFAEDMNAVALHPDLADIKFTWPMKDGSVEVIQAHQVVLFQTEYFSTMFSGRYAEATSNESGLSLHGMAQDGYNVNMFKMALRWMYTGNRDEVAQMDFDTVVEVLMMANLLGLGELMGVCTKILSEAVASSKSIEVTKNCWEVAESLGMQRLKTQCEGMLLTL